MLKRPQKRARNQLAGTLTVFRRVSTRLKPRNRRASRLLVGITAVCLAIVAWQVQRAFALTTTFIAHYDNGSLNADYSFGSGTASTISSYPTLLSTGYGGAGGSVLNASGRTLKYPLANNLNSQKGKISLKYQLPWYLGTDYSVFNNPAPSAVYYDSASGYYYMTDYYNGRIIKTKADGTGWTTLGSNGTGIMQFNGPTYIDYDPASEYIYVVDSSNYRIVKTKIDGTGWTTLGTYATSYAVGKFASITGLTYDPVEDYIYVVDDTYDKIIKTKMDLTGWTAYGTTSSPPSTAGKFSSPRGISYDSSTGYIYVGENYTSYQRIDKLKIDGTGWTTYGASGSGTGQFNYITDLKYTSTGDIYVYDRSSSFVSRVIRTRIDGSNWASSPAGYTYSMSYSGGGYGIDYDAANDQVINPTGLSGINKTSFTSGAGWYGVYGTGTGQFGGGVYFDYDPASGYYYVADYNNARIVKTKLDGTGWTAFGTSGTGVNQFYRPTDISYDPASGYIYVADYGNSRIVRTKIDGTGWATIPLVSVRYISYDAAHDVIYATSNNRQSIVKLPVAGFSLGYYYSSGSSSTGRFSNPYDIDYDSSTGYYYIIDYSNSRIVKTQADGTGWTTYGTAGSSTGNFSSPMGIAFDPNTAYIYVADYSNNRIVRTKIDGTGWATLGGTASGSGTGQFYGPRDVDIDPATGYLYVVDTRNNRLVKTLIDGTGWTTYGSNGSGDGKFSSPYGLDYDPASDYVYVLDASNSRVVKTKMDGTGWTTLTVGTTTARIAYDASTDYVYVADSNNNRILKTKMDGTGQAFLPMASPTGIHMGASGQVAFTSSYNIVGAISTDSLEYGNPTIAGTGTGYFSNPNGIQIDSSTGYLYIADYSNNRLVKTKMDGTGWTTYGSYGGGQDNFYQPSDLQWDASTGLLTVLDSGNNRVVKTQFGGTSWSQYFIPSSYNGSAFYDSSSNLVSYSFTGGSSWASAPQIVAAGWGSTVGYNRVAYTRNLTNPTAVAYDSTHDMVYTLDYNGSSLVQSKTDGSQYHTYGTGGSGDGQLSGALGIDYMPDSNKVIIADTNNHRLVVTGPNGEGWTTIGSTGSGTNQFSYPYDVYYDNSTGYVYVADSGNNRIVKTKLDGSVWQTIPIAAPKNVSVEDGYIYVVLSRYPYLTKIKDTAATYLTNDVLSPNAKGMCYDEMSGYAYIADYNNHQIVRMKLDGTDVSTLGTLGTGTGQFNHPYDVDYDPATGYLYVTDVYNHRIVKTKMDGTGWTTLGGTSPGSGVNQFYYPYGLSYDAGSGYIYVADSNNYRIVKTKIDGTGWTTYGSSGSTVGKFSSPMDVSYDAGSGYIYVADYSNARIVKTQMDGTGWTTLGSGGNGTGQFYYPRSIDYDPATGLIYVADGNSYYRVTATNIEGTSWRSFQQVNQIMSVRYLPSSKRLLISNNGLPTVIDFDGFDTYSGSTAYTYMRGHFVNGYWYLAEANGTTSSRLVRTNTAGDDFTGYGRYGSSAAAGYFYNPYTPDIDPNTGYIYVPNNTSSYIDKTTITGAGWTAFNAGAYDGEATLFSTNGSQPLSIVYYPSESKIGIFLSRGATNAIGLGKSSVISGNAGDWQTLDVSYDNTSGVTAKVNDTTVLQKNLTWNSFSWGDSFLVGNDATDTTKSFNGALDEVEISSAGSDTTAPTIPVLATAHDSSTGTTDLSADGWNPYTNPYFTWTATDDGGAGIKDYLVYFGTNASADPYLQGSAQTAANYTASNLVSGTTYYLIAQTRDGVGNLSTKTTLFTYRYDGTAPESPTALTVTPPGNSRSTHFDFVWPTSGAGAGSDAGGSGLLGYQYRILNKNGVAVADWSTVDLTGAAGFDIPAPDTDFIGTNKIEVRAVDNAGNVDATPLTSNFYYSAAATAPRNLTASPATSSSSPSDTNSFSFTWSEPSAYPGQGYFYSINVLPTENNKLTAASTSLSANAYASQQGRNTLYVLAADGDNTNYDSCSSISGNPDVDACAKVDFYAQTPAPGYPNAVKVYDISNRDTSEYSVALKWSPPTSLGTGFDGYNVYRSLSEGSGYAKIGSSQGTSYIDDNLTKETPYFYQLKSKDNTGQESVASQSVNVTPTGKYTNPPILKDDVVNVTTKAYSAVLTWETRRADSDEVNAGRSSSFVKYGLTRDTVGKENGGWTVGDPNKVEAHSVNLTGLDPETIYYYQVMWEDVDGNQGSSEISTLATKEKPQIANVTVDNITLKSANINWESINVVSARISYCSSNSCQDMVISTTADQPTHTVNVSNLTHTTNYRFTISTTDIDGNVTPSDAYSFATLTMPMTEGDLKMDQDTAAPTTTYRLRWTTNIPTTTILNYTREGGQTLTVSQAEYTTDHDVTVNNLADQSKYGFEATGVDEHGNRVDNPLRASVSTPQDSRPPSISNLTIEIKSSGVSGTQKDQIVASWETDELSTSQIEYGAGISGSDYTQKTAEDAALTNYHVVIVNDLEPSKMYHLRVVSRDAAGNAGYSDDTTAITGKLQNSAIDLIINSLRKSLGWLTTLFQ